MGNPSQIEVKLVTAAVPPVTLWWGYADSLAAGVSLAIRRGFSLAGVDLRGQDLSGGDFTAGNFTGARFEGANCIGCVFTNCNLTNADFSGAAVTEAVFGGATLTGIDQDTLATAVSAVASLASATPAINTIPLTGPATTSLAEGFRRGTVTAVNAFPYVVLATDECCEVTLGAGAVVAQLPTAAGIAGREITFKIVATGGGNLSVTPAGVEQIDLGGAGVPYVLTVLNSSVTLKSNGVGWKIVYLQPYAGAHAVNHLNAGTDPVRLTVRTPAAGACAILATDHHVRAASLGAGAVAATLYAADAAAVGRVVTVIKVDAAADDVAVTPAGAELINGANAPFLLAAQWNSVTLLCVAVGQWEVID